MTKQKTTKKALVLSALALCVCIAMFIGSTYAWFTDSVTSAGNVIKSGTLDVTMEWANGTKAVPADNSNDWTDASTGAIFDYDLWEPGYTEVRHIKIANEGNLALKYQLNIVANGKVSELADVIDVYYMDPAVQVANRADLTDANKLGTLSDVLATISTTASGNLKAGEKDTITLALKMQESAGNKYQNLEIGSDFSVQLMATQLTSEFDSIDNQYDANAMYPGEVGTEAELAAALAKGGNIKLANNITTENGFLLEDAKDIVLNLNGHTLTATGEKAKLFSIGGDADLTIYGGKLVAESTNGGAGTSTGASTSVYFWSSGNLTMTDVEIEGSVRGGHRAIDVYSGKAVLTNVDITTSYGSGVNAGRGNDAGTPAVVVLNDCDITVNGMYSAPYNSVCFSVMGAGEMTINSGNYKMINNSTYATGNTHGGWVGIVMNSGGILTINDGTYTNVPTEGFVPQNERAIIHADAAIATVNLNGGTFDPQEDALIAGTGTFNGELVNNGNGTWTARKRVVS